MLTGVRMFANGMAVSQLEFKLILQRGSGPSAKAMQCNTVAVLAQGIVICPVIV